MMSTEPVQPPTGDAKRRPYASDFEVRRVQVQGPEKATFDVFVPASLKFFEGHFDGSPIVPGVAQVILCEQLAREHLTFAPLGAAAGMQRLKFLAAIGPDEALTVTLNGRATESEAAVQFSVMRGDTACATGTLKFAIA